MGILYMTNHSLPSNSLRTNFALWSLYEGSDQVRMRVATVTLSCPYYDNNYAWVGSFCTFLRDHLSHGQPPLYDKNDYSYTVHRAICWTLFFGSIVSSCWKRNQSANAMHNLSGFLVLDSLLDLVLLPVQTALQVIWISSFVVYPAWLRMHTITLLQHKNSWFYDSFFLSALSLLLLAAACNALSRGLLSSDRFSFQLGRSVPAPAHALVAVTIGYYRGSFGPWSLVPSNWYGNYTPTTINWILLSLVVVSVGRRRDYGLGILFSWVIANLLGSMFGQYQQQQQALPVMANSLTTAWNDFWHSLTRQ